MNPKSKHSGDPNLAIHAAGHFFELAGTFFGQLPVDKAEFDSFLKQPKNIGRLIVASTNLAFSIELYLKGLAMKTKGYAIAGHELVNLFNDLPVDIRDLIQQRYHHRFIKRKKSNFRVIDFIISTHNQPPSETNKMARILNVGDEANVCKVLAVEKDAFQKWRYVYEQAPPAGWVAVTVHYCHLCILVNSIQDLFIPPDRRP
jgi:hypothetical protein